MELPKYKYYYEMQNLSTKKIFMACAIADTREEAEKAIEIRYTGNGYNIVLETFKPKENKAA